MITQSRFSIRDSRPAFSLALLFALGSAASIPAGRALSAGPVLEAERAREAGWIGGSIGQQDPGVRFRITSANAVGLTVVNTGFLGNNFVSRSPSFEFPIGSNQDHMPKAGFWIGGISDSGDTLVSVAVTDGAVGGVIPGADFLPTGDGNIEERSRVASSPDYSPLARSDQDFIFVCADTAAMLSGESPDSHRALGVQVRQEVLSYNTSPLDAVVFVNLFIKNVNAAQTLRDVEVGMYAELASGYKSNVPNWISGWFKKKVVGYVDSLDLVSEHHYSLGGGRCPSWAGVALLGTSPPRSGEVPVSFNWWNWDPTRNWSDPQRYLLLGNGEQDPTDGITPGIDDPVNLLSVGPLGSLKARAGDGRDQWRLPPGDSIVVSFAFIGGIEDPFEPRTAEQDLLWHASAARQAFPEILQVPDRAPPALTLAVLQNPVLTRCLDLYMLTDEPLAAAPVILQVNADSLEMRRTDPRVNLWRADYVLQESTRSLLLRTCVTDTVHNRTCGEHGMAAGYLKAGTGGTIVGPGGGVVLSVPPGALARDAFVLVAPQVRDGSFLDAAARSGKATVSVASPGLTRVPEVGCTLSPPGILSGTARLEIEVPPECLAMEPDLSRWRLELAQHGPIPTLFDPVRRTLVAEVTDLGVYRLVSGPSGSSHALDPQFLSEPTVLPNPAGAMRTIRYEVRETQPIKAEIYDVAGHRIRTLMEKTVGPGVHTLSWNGQTEAGADVPSGVYFCTIQAGSQRRSSRILVVR